MTPTDPSKRLSLALSILAELPTGIRALSADGGVVPLRVVGSDATSIEAYAPAGRVHTGLRLTVRARDNDGAGHDIELEATKLVHHSDDEARAQLVVHSVRSVDGSREYPRGRVDDLALVRVEFAEHIPSGAESDVRMVDLGAGGVAFVTDARLREGDRIAVMATVDRQVLRVSARVLNVTLAHYGRRRVGCDILGISDADRQRLADLAGSAPEAGTRDQRLTARPAV